MRKESPCGLLPEKQRDTLIREMSCFIFSRMQSSDRLGFPCWLAERIVRLEERVEEQRVQLEGLRFLAAVEHDRLERRLLEIDERLKMLAAKEKDE